MVVAPGALHRQADKRGHGGRHHVVTIEIARDFLVDRSVLNAHLRAFIPRPRRQETGCGDGVRVVRKQNVSGNLLRDEAGVRFVLIERAYHVVAIRPGVFANRVLIVAVGLGVMNHIQPVPRPALPVARARKQLIHHSFKRARRPVVDKAHDTLRRRGEPGQVQRRPPKQRPAVRFR